MKCSQHHWGQHGIAGRGVLLDWRGFCDKHKMEFNSFDADEITHEALVECGKEQGIDIRPAAQGGDIQPGDMLFIRSGFVRQYRATDPEVRDRMAMRKHAPGKDDGQRWAGLKQESAILDWLHDCWFASVAGDSPSFEAWPSRQGK